MEPITYEKVDLLAELAVFMESLLCERPLTADEAEHVRERAKDPDHRARLDAWFRGYNED